MAGAELLRFPVPGDGKRELLYDVRPKPSLRKFSNADAVKLHATARRIYEGIGILTEFIDSHRESAVDAGMETIAVELAAERENLDDVLSALEEAVQKDSSVNLTLEGLALLRRLEKLLSEASSNMARFTDRSPFSSPQKENFMGGASADLMIVGPIVFFGLIAVSLVAIAVFSGRD
jgi:hypothetical protein